MSRHGLVTTLRTKSRLRRWFASTRPINYGIAARCDAAHKKSQLGVAAAISLNLRAVHGRSLRGRPHHPPPDGSAAAAVLIRGSDPPGPARAGIGTGQRYPGEPAPRWREWEAGPACKLLPKPSVRSGRPASEGSNMAKSPSTRKRATRASSPPGENEILPIPAAQDRAAAGRGGWRAGGPPPQGREPASLLRDDCAPRLQPLAGAGPAHRHRLGRLARSRAATCSLSLSGLTARVFGPPGEPLSEAFASERGDFVGSRLELHDADEPNCPLRVEQRVDAFHHVEDLGS